jgi:ADP-ribosylglycohydrolase
MLGAIIGDIIGSPYEFRERPQWDFAPLVSDRASWTDDTLMTLAVADAVLAIRAGRPSGEDGERIIADTMRRYARAYPLPRGGYGSKFLGWVLSPGQRAYGSLGNGSAMRVSSVGWLFETLPEVLEWAGSTARVTHNHPEGIAGAKAVAGGIYLLRTGASPLDVRDWAATQFGYDLSLTLERSQENYVPNATCVGTVPQAIMAFINSTDFETAIRNAVSFGGDTDTLAAIAGSLAEARYGVPDQLREVALGRLGVPLGVVVDAWEEAITRPSVKCATATGSGAAESEGS